MMHTELRDRRKALGLTQQALADILGVTQQTVDRWEHGKRAVPSFLHLALDFLVSDGECGECSRQMEE